MLFISKVVIDTNVFFSSFKGGNPQQILMLVLDHKLTLLISQPIS